MHPILASPGRLAVYLVAWLAPGGVLGFMLALGGPLKWSEAIAAAAPPTLFLAFVCLSPWYVCRVLPLKASIAPRVFTAHLLASFPAAGLTLLASKQTLAAAERALGSSGLEERVTAQYPLLFGMSAVLYLLAVALHYVYLAAEASRAAETRAVEARGLAKDAELKTLKMQVNPHFLFNSLNSISALTTADPAKARRMCVMLSDFLRSTLGLGERESIPFSEEMGLIRSYLAVEQVRFGARMRVEESIEASGNACAIPPLLLLPLVENAVKHGVATLVDGGQIRLSARCEAARLVVEIENEFDAEAPPAVKNGLGLVNVRNRMEARYGAAARLRVSRMQGRFVAEVTLPVEVAS